MEKGSEIKIYLGINVDYDCKKGIMKLDQRAYVESLAQKYNITDAKLYCSPMEQNLSLEPAQAVSNEIKYRNLIGALLYIISKYRACNDFEPQV